MGNPQAQDFFQSHGMVLHANARFCMVLWRICQPTFTGLPEYRYYIQTVSPNQPAIFFDQNQVQWLLTSDALQ